MWLKDSKKDVKTREINLKIRTVGGEKEIIYDNVLWCSNNRVWILYESDYGIMLENTTQGTVDYPIMYNNGDIVYDHFYLPNYVKKNVKRVINKYFL